MFKRWKNLSFLCFCICYAESMKNKTAYPSTSSGQIRLYNIIFPLFMLMLLSPLLWVVMLIGNFLFDSLVLYLSCKVQKIANFRQIWKKNILKIFLAGFAADWLGCLFNTILWMFVLPYLWPSLSNMANSYFFPGNVICALPALLTAMGLIYWFNKRYILSKSELSPAAQKKTAWHLAAFTAPYVMFIPYDLLTMLFGGH